MLTNSSLFRRIELQLLMNLTAQAFGQPSKRIWTLPHDKALRTYAEFTCSKLTLGVDEALLWRMNEKAYQMGHMLRRLLFIRKPATAEHFITTLYRNIGIHLSFTDSEHLCFHHCYFSHYYTPTTCLAASALDEGIIRGLTAQPAFRLSFSQRITAGCQCCKATFQTTHKKEKNEESHRNR